MKINRQLNILLFSWSPSISKRRTDDVNVEHSKRDLMQFDKEQLSLRWGFVCALATGNWLAICIGIIHIPGATFIMSSNSNSPSDKTQWFPNVGLLVANVSKSANKTQYVNNTTYQYIFLHFLAKASLPYRPTPVCPLNMERRNWYKSHLTPGWTATSQPLKMLK